MPQEQPDDLLLGGPVFVPERAVQGRAAELVLGVGVGPGGQQQLDAVHAAAEGGQVKRLPTAGIYKNRVSGLARLGLSSLVSYFPPCLERRPPCPGAF